MPPPVDAPVALITGITGQDGSYLAEFLLAKGYAVHGLRRRCSSPPPPHTQRLLAYRRAFTLHHGDMGDGGSLHRVLERTRPDEVYNLAAQGQDGLGAVAPTQTAEVDGMGALRLLEAIRRLAPARRIRFFQASSSDLFGQPRESPQDEATPFRPASPLGVAKLFAHWTTVNHREAYGLHAATGILFPHDSPRRAPGALARRIAAGVAAIHRGSRDELRLGALDAAREWGHARDHVEGMWRLLQQDQPGDYVLATGTALTLRDFTALAFRAVGIELRWARTGACEIGRCQASGRVLVRAEGTLPHEDAPLVGDPTKARRLLGWRPRVTPGELAAELVAAELSCIAAPEPVA